MKIGFLGFGKMGQAIGGGLAGAFPGIALGYYDARPLDPAPGIQGLTSFASIGEVEAFSDLLLLCVKPGDMGRAVADLKGDKKYISIAAGLQVSGIRSSFQCSEPVQIARVMPNISALIGSAVSGVYCEEAELRETTLALFNAIGMAVRIDKEELMHAVTGLSGSGPAYVFAFIQALAEGGVQAGLTYDAALQLAAATVQSSAAMLRASNEHPAALRNSVTSPGGTTIAGLKALEDRGFHGSIMEAVRAAAARSKELE